MVSCHVVSHFRSSDWVKEVSPMGPAWGGTWGLFHSVRGLSIHSLWCIACKGLLPSHAILGGCSMVTLALVRATTSSQGQTGGAWCALFHTRTRQALSSGVAPAAYNQSEFKSFSLSKQHGISIRLSKPPICYGKLVLNARLYINAHGALKC